MLTCSHLGRRLLRTLITIAVLATSLPLAPSGVVAQEPDPEVEKPAETRRLEPGLRLYAVCDPPTVEPGQQATCTVTAVNEDDEDMSNLKLSARLPGGLSLVGQRGSGSVWSGSVASLPVDESASVEFTVEVERSISEPQTFTVQARGGLKSRATTTAIVGVAGTDETQWVSRNGGEMRGQSGRVKIQFPGGAVRAAAGARVSAHTHEQQVDPRGRAKTDEGKGPQRRSGTLLHFSMEAEDASTGETIGHFAQPVSVSVDLRGLVDEAGLPVGHYLYLAHVVDPTTGEKEMVESVYDPETGLLTAEIDHFSEWEIGVVGGGWMPILTPPVPDLFSGAATYSYPIQVPAGRNGLQPNVVLSYNGRRIDMLKEMENEEGGPVALGWSLGGSDVEITRFHKFGSVSGNLELKDEFSLVLNGASYDLENPTSGFCGQYRVVGGPGVYVERRNASCEQGSTANRTTDFWIVRVEGTTYQLGYTLNSEADIEHGNRVVCTGCCSPDADSYGATRWRVDTVTDPMGNQMTFSYRETETKIEMDGADAYAERSMLTEIRYNNFGSGQWASKVVFVPATNDAGSDDYMRIKRIDVYHLGQRTRQVELTVNKKGWDGYSEWAIMRIQELSTGGTPMPPVEFRYEALPNQRTNYYYRRISEINLGYGGRTTFTYINDGRTDQKYSYRVSETKTYDGMSDTPSRVTYGYGQRCYDQKDPNQTAGGTSCRGSHAYEHTVGPLVGHDRVTVTAYDSSGAAVNQTIHRYYITDTGDNHLPPHWQRGKERKTEMYEGAGATLLQESVTTWAGDNDFSYVAETVSTDHSGGKPVSVKTTYAYEAAAQGGAQYGNLTHVREYGDGAAPYRTTMTEYNPNADTAVWILSTPKRVQVFEGNEGGTLLSRAETFYDGSTDVETDPIQGKPTMSRVYDVNDASWSTYAQTRSAYDQWGNLTVVTDTRGFATTIIYENVYGLYPITATNALDQGRYVEYYGVNDGAAMPDGEVVWVDDQLPAGATPYGSWTWITGNPSPFSGATAHQSGVASGAHQHYFGYASATLEVQEDDHLFAYVYLDPANPPREVMLQWNDGSWSHRAYWGENLIEWGTNGTDSRRYIGPLPEAGGWVRLQVKADLVGLTDRTVHGMAFTLYDGRATWDRAGRSGGGLPGQVRRVWDSNGEETATTYAYDGFGRLARVMRPFDSLTLPTTAYWYDETTGGSRVVHEYYSEVWRDTAYNTVSNWKTDVMKEYLYQGTPFRVRATQETGTVPLRRYLYVGGWHAYHHDTIYTTDGSPGSGWSDQGILGYVWTSPGAGRVGLYRCYQDECRTDDHLLVLDNEACPPEYNKEPGGRLLLGYVEPTNGAPIQVGASQREVSGQAGTLDSYVHYDGLGRQIQSRSEAEGGQWTVSSTAYDALGRAIKGYLPRFEEGVPYTVPDGLHTVTTYDAMGRAVRTVNPDNTSTSVLYDGLETVGIDGNGHLRISRSDVWGQLAEVDEPLAEVEDTFLTLDDELWTFSGHQSIENGTIRTDGPSSWNATFYRDVESVTENEGTFVVLKVDSTSALAAWGLETVPPYPDSTYRRWSLRVEAGKLRAFWCEGSSCNWVDLMDVKANTWYGLLLRVEEDGHGRLQVWERSDPGVSASYVSEDAIFGGRDYRLRQWTHTGASWMHRYDELTFATTGYEYDTLGHLVKVTDAEGNETEMHYDGLGHKDWMDDPDMGHWDYGYDPAGNLTEQTDARGCTIAFTYDPLNRVETKSYARCTGDPGPVTYYYDGEEYGYSIDRLTRMTDDSGATAYHYDERGRVVREVKTIDTESFETEYTYDDADRVTSMEYPDQEVVTYAYDDGGMLESLIGNAPYVTGVAYNPMGQITDIHLGNTLVTQYVYDPLSSRLERVNTEGLLDLRYDYDAVGNVSRIVKDPVLAGVPEQGVVYTMLDTFDSKDTSGWSWSSHQTVPHNDAGNMVVKSTGTESNWDANFYRTSYSLTHGDGVELRFKVDQDDTRAHFSIETDGYRFGVIADEGVLYAQYNTGSGWQYPGNVLDDVQLHTWYAVRISVDDVNGFRVEAYQLDDPANKGSASVAMPAGQQWRFHHWTWRGGTYLDNYREFKPGDTFDTKDTVNWVWNGHQTVLYDDGGDGVVKSSGTGSNWDGSFYRSGFDLTDGAGIQLRFKVDRTDTQAHFTVRADNANYRRFGVIADGGKLYVQCVDYGSSVRVWYPADVLAELKVDTWYVLRILIDDADGFYVEVYEEGNPEISGSYWGVMPAGRRWRFRHWIWRGNAYIDDYGEFDTGQVTWTGSEEQVFQYDHLDRLTHAQAIGGPAPYDRTYAYDAIGNILNKSDVGNYTYEGNTYTHGQPHGVTHIDGQQRYWYDENGNQTTRIAGGKTYVQSFDASNKLQSVTEGGETTTFTHDGNGTRVKKEAPDGTVTYYVGGYYEVQGSTVTKYYYAGAQRVAMRRGSEVTYLHGDHLGSTSLTTNEAGGFEARVLYYPYGEERYTEGTLLTDYGYTGQRSEAGFGLMDYNARYYDPALGRFVTADTIVPDPANPQSFNRFAYVYSNPQRYVDPTGHFSWDQIAEFLGWSSKHVLPGHAYYPDTANGTDPVIISAGAHLKAAYDNGDIVDDRLLATIDMLQEAEFGDIVLAGTGTDSGLGYAADALMFVASEYDEANASIMLWSFGKEKFVNGRELDHYSKWELYETYRGPGDCLLSPYSPTSFAYNETGIKSSYNVKNMVGIGAPFGFPREDGLWVDPAVGIDVAGALGGLPKLFEGDFAGAFADAAGAIHTFPVAAPWYEVAARHIPVGPVQAIVGASTAYHAYR
jgi:RHS repeat-associated protein